MSTKPNIKVMNIKKKFVADGVFHAELHQFLEQALQTAGYAGIEIRVTPVKTEIRIKATKSNEVIGPDGRKIRELISLVQKRFNYPKDTVDIRVINVPFRGLCASAQCENLRFKLLSGAPVRMAANGVIKSVMRDGAKGCEVIISGKLRQQRAKTMKYKQGYMVTTGQPKLDYVDTAVRHVFFKQGIMGVKVKIMLPYDPSGKKGVKQPLPDNVIISDPKEDNEEEIRTAQAQQTEQ